MNITNAFRLAIEYAFVGFIGLLIACCLFLCGYFLIYKKLLNGQKK